MSTRIERYAVQVYKRNAEPELHPFFTQGCAADFARQEFKKRGVYKVKVWDKLKGDIVPNTPQAPGLIYEFV